MKVFEYFDQRKAAGLFGVEIEAEGINLPPVDNKHWKTVQDGSLRGGLEYVFKQPLSLDTAKEQVKVLLEGIAPQASFSYRTSIHVHVNVGMFDRNQLMRFIYTWMLFEEHMLKLCGKGRVGNRFCLRMRDAEGYLDRILKAFEKPFPSLHPDHVKYSAMNLASLSQYGSIEIRSMEGTSSHKRVSQWLDLLNAIHTFAFVSTLSLKDMFLMDFKELRELVFDDKLPSYANEVEDFEYAKSLTIQFPFEVKEDDAPL